MPAGDRLRRFMSWCVMCDTHSGLILVIVHEAFRGQAHRGQHRVCV